MKGSLLSTSQTFSCPLEVDRNNWLTTGVTNGEVCEDDSGWDNNHGKTCADYVSFGWCVDGEESSNTGLPYSTLGAQHNYPENHCCECGKKNPRLNLAFTCTFGASNSSSNFLKTVEH